MILKKIIPCILCALSLAAFPGCRDNSTVEVQKSAPAQAEAAAPQAREATAPKAPAQTNAVAWMSQMDAQKSAAGSGKPVYLHFFTEWCGYCKKMDRETFSNPKVISYLNENFLPVRMNPEKSQEAKVLSSAFGVRGFPANGFSVDGVTPIGTIPGFLPPETFLNLLQYVKTDSYKTMTMDEFLKKRQS